MDERDTESVESPESISELDQLKMELEQDFFNELSKEEDKCNQSQLEDEEGDDEDDGEVVSMESSKEDDVDEKSQDQEEMSKEDLRNKSSKHSIETRMQSKTVEGKKTNKMIMHNMEKLWLAAPLERPSCILRNDKCNNYVVTIKIFDRGLVVNDFSDETSLYTLCRAWMKNQRTSLVSSQHLFACLAAASKRQNNGQEVLKQLKRGEQNLICSMPANPVLKSTTQMENSQKILVEKRVPDLTALDNALKASDENLTIDEGNITSKENLLSEHKLQWKRTKLNWIKTIRDNNKKHEVNFAIIDALFKPHIKINSSLFESEQAN